MMKKMSEVLINFDTMLSACKIHNCREREHLSTDSLIQEGPHNLQQNATCKYGATCIYSGTSLLWTPWGPNKVSCIERCPHFRGKFILRKHIWDIAKCP